MLADYELSVIVEPLLAWFSQNARILPWREEPTPYRVWVSEIMLQQTRVEAVKPYFERFMKELPTVEALSECSQERLLKLWEGLGYYNRVKNMQVAAKTVMEEYNGRLPKEKAELMKLKGIGSYTAGAISSIAYGMPNSAVDGNVLRVISRVCEEEGDVLKDSVKRQFERKLDEIMPKGRASQFNQALMELGAKVCIPNGTPLCEECPLENMCQGRKHNSWKQYPVKKKEKPRRIEERTVFVILQKDSVALRKRPEKGLLSGMYEFPNVLGKLTKEQAGIWLREQGIPFHKLVVLKDAKHIFSHIEWHMTGYLVVVEEFMEVNTASFVSIEDMERDYAIPTAFEAYVKELYVGRRNQGTAETI